MGGLRVTALGTFTCLALIGCGAERRDAPPPPPPSAASLGGTTVARVGDRPIDAALVTSLARARKLAPKQALDVIVEESLLARFAEEQGASSNASVKQRIAAAQARALFARMLDDAKKRGPFTEAEMAALQTEDWIDVDRPETRLVVHALVLKEVKDGAALAKRLRDELRAVTAPGEKPFIERAKAFAMPPGQKALVVETLDQPFTADGRIAVKGSGSRLDEGFSKAAHAIEKVGDVSDVVETPFGWHVMRLLETRPGFRAPYDERVKRMEAALLRARVLPEHQAKIAALRAAAKVEMLATDHDLALPRISEGDGAAGR